MGIRAAATLAYAFALIGLVACSAAPTATATGLRWQAGTLESTIQSAPAPARLPAQRVLAIQIDYQDHRLSCEAAALKMALAYEGIKVDEMTLLRYMSLDSRPPRFSGGKLVTWGDPAKAYVGNPDGHIEWYTGYGVYNAPLAKAAIRAGAAVQASGSGLYGSGIAPSAIYAAVLTGHPAVVWISNTYRQVPLAEYIAYDGARVWYTLTEHAVTVVGVKPGAVLINDPWFGKAWHSKVQFESAYKTFDHMAVIIEK
jgi:uncharacterized protein YvpB